MVKHEFWIDDELSDLIQATLPADISIPIASKALLIWWAASNLKEKEIYEAIGRMQFRKVLRSTIKYLEKTNIDLRIKAIEDFLNEQEKINQAK